MTVETALLFHIVPALESKVESKLEEIKKKSPFECSLARNMSFDSFVKLYFREESI